MLILAVATSGLLLLTGCANNSDSTPVPSPSALVQMSSAQRAALADGKVTYDEYKAAFRRYVACDSKAGYKVLTNGETNEVVDFAVPAAAVDSGVDDRCNHREFWNIDSKWQLSREDTSQQAAAYGKCLQAAGITPKATETEKFHQLQQAHIDPTQCYLNNGTVPTTGSND